MAAKWTAVDLQQQLLSWRSHSDYTPVPTVR